MTANGHRQSVIGHRSSVIGNPKQNYMNWYLAKIVFRIICGDGNHTAQFDEQLRLIAADDENEAFLKAKAIGQQEEETFINQNQKMVAWQFVNLSELYKITALIDGAELYSKIRETDNAELYTTLVNKHASHIQHNITHKYLQLL